MHKEISDFEELPQGWGRLYVGPLPMDTGPVRVGDTVTVKIAADIELYIQVENSTLSFWSGAEMMTRSGAMASRCSSYGSESSSRSLKKVYEP